MSTVDLSATGSLSLRSFLLDTYAKHRRLSAGAFDQYRWVVDSLDRWNGAPVMLSDLTDELAADWLKYLNGRGLALVTVQNHRRVLFTLWAAAELLYPGCGAAHLGHVIDQGVARKHYLDPRLLAKYRPMPRALVKGGVA